MSGETQKKFLLGNYELDAGRHLLLRENIAVPLSKKRFQVLLYLVEERHRLVTRQELIERFWDGNEVYEENLTKCISEIRKALDDQKRPHQLIATTSAVGYRYVGPVEEVGLPWRVSGVEIEKLRGVRIVIDEDHPEPVLLEELPPELPPPSTLQRTSIFQYSKRYKVAAALALLVFAGIVFGLYKVIGRWRSSFGASGVETPTVLRTMQVTSWSGLDLYPSFSPDGGSIAYSSDKSGSFEIYVKQLAVGGREIQVTSDGQQNFEPTWSPDGKMIAYHSRNRGGVWLMPALGGVPKQITDFGSYPSWSPDGSMIAFQSVGIGDALLSVSSNALPPSTIWVVTLQSGTSKQVTKAGEPAGGHGAPVWAPNGRRIAFASYSTSQSPEVWSVGMNGSGPKLIVRQGFAPIYSPDGGSLYFVGSPGNLSFGIWQVRISSSDDAANGAPVKILDAGAVSLKHLGIDSTGKKVTYGSLLQTSNVWSLPISASSSEPTGPPVPLTRETTFRSTSPSISPDGKKIAFSVYRVGQGDNIWVMNADGSNPTQITAEGGGVPAWSADGTEIVFGRARGSLESIPLAGGKSKLIVELGPGVSFQRLSPDGKQIVYNTTSGGATNLWLTSLEGGNRTQLTFDSESMGFACWSPDGKHLALGIKRGEDGYIGLMPSTGGDVQQLTFDHGISAANSWSPDGNKIAFAGSRNGYWNVYWISHTTKEQKQLTKYNKLNINVRYPAWSPLGTQIVYEQTEVTGNIWLLQLK